MTERYRDRRHGGFHLIATPAGEPLDRRKDLYAHAFVLLACAAYARVTRESAPIALAHETMDLLESKLGDRVHGGFFDEADEGWTPRREPRRQNPHMHLLEACLALAELDRDSRWRDLARALFELFSKRFRDPATGTLGEHFARDWAPAPGDAGACVEPGHHY